MTRGAFIHSRGIQYSSNTEKLFTVLAHSCMVTTNIIISQYNHNMPSSPSRTIVLRSTDTELMPPPAKRIKRPQKLLDEDDYTDAISEIIARDFFPGLLETETQQEYLDAIDSRDPAWISSASRRLAQVMTPGRKRGRKGTSIQSSASALETPTAYGGETPISVVSETSATSAHAFTRPRVDISMSLDTFQSKYTSEDNESFYKLLDKQNQKRAEKYAWMWRGNKLPSKMQIKQKEVETKLLQMRGSLDDDGGKKDRIAIRDQNEKPAMPDSWKSKPNNNFMFGPDSVEDSVETVAQKAQLDSRAAPKGVVYGNTRMQVPEISIDDAVPPSPSLSAVRDAIAGRPRQTRSESGYDGGETPRVNGYAFVDDEPGSAKLATYSSHIVDLGKGDATPNPFKIKTQSRREALHHEMVNQTSKNRRSSSKIGMTGKVDTTPVPQFPSSPRVGPGGLTPAAQRLWSKVERSSRPGTPGRSMDRTPAKGMGSGLSAHWTHKSKDGRNT